MTQQFTYTFRGAQAKKKLLAATMLGLSKWAELVLQQSRADVPLDEATLERSGVASTDPHLIAAAVSYDTPYAVNQHENLQYHHPGGRKAKYLEVHWLESQKWALPLIAKELRRATAHG
jgi:hypothetical protein